MSTHAAWDSLTAEVSPGAPAARRWDTWEHSLNNCVACHAPVRINVGR